MDILRSLPFLFCAFLLKPFGLHKTSVAAILFQRIFLFCKPTSEDTAWVSQQLKKNHFDILSLVLSTFMLPASLERLIFGRTGADYHHEARVAVISKYLPHSEVIVDVGGSSAIHPTGALLGMGYPYRPSSIWIVDLPPEHRLSSQKSLFESEKILEHEGSQIHYLFGSMEDLSRIPSGEVDLVWSGQSIEHIDVEAMRRMLREIRRVLRPQGYFCLDTPNRNLSALLARIGYIHPEHKTEYSAPELAAELKAAGFEIEKSLAISPMPRSKRWKRFCRLELFEAPLYSDNVEDGFSFFLRAKKLDGV